MKKRRRRLLNVTVLPVIMLVGASSAQACSQLCLTERTNGANAFCIPAK
jgi:hypothetical protein